MSTTVVVTITSPAVTNDASPSLHHEVPISVIVGSLLGGIVFVAIILGLIYWNMYRLQRRKAQELPLQEPNYEPKSSSNTDLAAQLQTQYHLGASSLSKSISTQGSVSSKARSPEGKVAYHYTRQSEIHQDGHQVYYLQALNDSPPTPSEVSSRASSEGSPTLKTKRSASSLTSNAASPKKLVPPQLHNYNIPVQLSPRLPDTPSTPSSVHSVSSDNTLAVGGITNGLPTGYATISLYSEAPTSNSGQSQYTQHSSTGEVSAYSGPMQNRLSSGLGADSDPFAPTTPIAGATVQPMEVIVGNKRWMKKKASKEKLAEVDVIPVESAL